MKKKNNKYADRIRELKNYNVKDKKKFNEELKNIMTEFGFSRATVYRDMNKKQPAMRKRRSDSGKVKNPVTRNEQKIITEAMLAGRTKQQAIAVAEEMLDEKISTRKGVRIETDAEVEITVFASEAKKFIDKILQLDLIAPEAGMYFKYKDIAFKVEKNYLEDIALILATAYNQQAGAPLLAVDREQLVRSQLFHLIQEAMRVANDQFDIHLYRELSKMYKDLKGVSSKIMSTDFYVVERAMKFVKPDLTKEEIITIIKKFSE